jgi:biofilm protein TabA
MRRVAHTRIQLQGICRVILYACEDGVYLFLSDSLDDVGCRWDDWYPAVAAAEAAALERFGIASADWTDVPDPEAGCFHDHIAATRRRPGDDDGRERLVDGVWVAIADPE